MAVVVLLWISLVFTVIGSDASGEFSVLYCPDSLKFSESEKTLESFLKEIFSAALGLSVEENPDWRGMFIIDPFNTPEAAVEVYIDGVSSLGEYVPSLKAKTFLLTADEYEPDTFLGVKHRIKQRFTSGGNRIANIKLSDDDKLSTYKDVFGDVISRITFKKKLIHLKHTVEEDYRFLSELGTLNAVMERVQSGAVVPDNIIDFYIFRFRTLHGLSDFYGPNSLQTKEAKTLLRDALEDLTRAFVKAYDRSVLVSVVTTDVAHTRRSARSLLEIPPGTGKTTDPGETTQSDGTTETTIPWLFPRSQQPDDWPENMNMHAKPDKSHDYGWHKKQATGQQFDANYAAIFNILLWFGVVMSFSLLAILHSFMDMDPGRDSIIYRMTSTRMKKDN